MSKKIATKALKKFDQPKREAASQRKDERLKPKSMKGKSK